MGGKEGCQGRLEAVTISVIYLVREILFSITGKSEKKHCSVSFVSNPNPCIVGNKSCLVRPRSIYQYSNMALRLPGQTSIFGVVFFIFKSLLGVDRQKKLKKFTILTRKPRSHVRILIYRTWPIQDGIDVK